MDIKLELIKVRDVVNLYKDNAEDGVIGYGGKLDIRPAYQREYVYNVEKRDEVIKTIMRGFPHTRFPLNVMYWAQTGEDSYEVIDGQQRTISICMYVDGAYSVIKEGNPQGFNNLSPNQKEYFLDYELQVYICSGTPDEKLEWFTIINTAGEPLLPQELLNANYTGTWLSSAKRYFMKSNSAGYGLASRFIEIEANQSRGKGLETALRWVSKDNIKLYMANHQNDENADLLWSDFKNIIQWIEKVFINYNKSMKGLNWGKLYDNYHLTDYNSKEVAKKVEELQIDNCVNNFAGIYEFILGGSIERKILSIRVFEEATKKVVYNTQTKTAKDKKLSNCPLCAIGNNSNKDRIYELKEMDADHVTAWSNGGETNIKNCEMLCITHNRAKGNK